MTEGTRFDERPWPQDEDLRRKLKRQTLAIIETLDEALGDTDLPGDDSAEFRACQALNELAEREGWAP